MAPQPVMALFQDTLPLAEVVGVEPESIALRTTVGSRCIMRSTGLKDTRSWPYILHGR